MVVLLVLEILLFGDDEEIDEDEIFLAPNGTTDEDFDVDRF